MRNALWRAEEPRISLVIGKHGPDRRLPRALQIRDQCALIYNYAFGRLGHRYLHLLDWLRDLSTLMRF